MQPFDSWSDHLIGNLRREKSFWNYSWIIVGQLWWLTFFIFAFLDVIQYWKSDKGDLLCWLESASCKYVGVNYSLALKYDTFWVLFLQRWLEMITNKGGSNSHTTTEMMPKLAKSTICKMQYVLCFE